MKESYPISTRISPLIKRWLAPPIFPDDQLKTRRASLLDMALLVTMALALIILVGNLLGGRTPIAIIGADILAVVWCLILRYWAHHGQVRWASIVLIGADLIGTTVFSASLGTIRTPTTAFYLLIVVGAGLLFDVTGIIATTVLSSLAILGLIWWENAGWLPQPDYTVTITQWITYTALFGLAGVLTWAALKSTRQTLRRVAEELAERRRAQEELQETRDRLQQSQQFSQEIISGAGEGIAVYDLEFRYLVWNKFMENITGVSDSEVIGKKALDVFPHLREQGIDRLLEQALTGEIVYSPDTPYRVPQTGKSGWVSGTYAPHHDGNGKIIGVVATIQDITERKQAEEALQRRADQLSALYEVTLGLTTVHDLQTLLQTIVDRATTLLNTPGAFVYLYDPEQQNMELRLVTGSGVPLGTRLELDEGMAGRVAQSKQPLIIGDYQAWEHRSRKYEDIPFRATLEVPMLYAGEFIGVVGVYEIGSSARKFTEADAHLLSLFATQAASAFHNARLHETAKHNSERVALLNTIARTVGSTIELDDLLETCLRQLLRVVPADSYYIGLYDPKEDAIDIRIHFDAGKRYPRIKLPTEKGLSNLVLKERKPLLIRRLSEEMVSLPIKPFITGTGRASESWLGVPMTAGNELIGLLAFASYRPEAFDEEDEALLSTVASQVAIAVDNAQHHAEVEDQARRDSLTQVFNHGYLLNRLREEIEKAQITGSTVSLIMLDIDHFKEYNDTYGHVLGDEVLRLTVQAIQTHLKKSDIVGRWGGEEFAIVLPCAMTDQARVVAERIRSTLVELPLADWEGKSLSKPTVSQGIATFPFNASRAEKLVDVADRALYLAKQQGRDQTQVAPTDQPDTGLISDSH